MKSNIELDKYLKLLDGRSPDWGVQREAVDYVVKHGRHLIGSLIPNLPFDSWSNCVNIIEKVGYPENEVAIPGLLLLLPDLNWYGAEKAFQLLLKMEPEKLLPHIKAALRQADKEMDYIWVANLVLLIEKVGITPADISDKELLDIIEKREW